MDAPTPRRWDYHNPLWLSLAGVLLVVLLAVPIAVRLASFPEPHPLREWLIPEPSALVTRTVDFGQTAQIAGTDVLQLRLRAGTVRGLAAASEIELFVATHGTQPQLVEATLSMEGTSCQFRTPPRTQIRDNSLIPFQPNEKCREFDGFPSGDVLADIRIESGSGRVALWTYQQPGTTPLLFLLGETPLAVRGSRTIAPPPLTRTRVALLAYMWNVTPSVVWARLRSGAVVIVAGVWLLLWRTSRTHAGRWQIARASVGAALLMAGLGLTHALLFPPLQAPDEPDHLLSLAQRTSDVGLERDTEALAKRTHFQRIRHNAEQHFREVDIMRPWPVAWDEEIRVELVGLRSPLTAWWWDLVAVRDNQTTAHLLWRLRRGDAVLFGLFCGLAVLVLAVALPAAHAPALVLGLLAIPTLPFFGAHFADTTVIVSVSLLLAASIAALVIDSPRSHWVSIALGAALILTLLSGRRMWPLLPVVAIVLVVHALTRRPQVRNRRELAIFWGTLAVSLGIGLIAAEQAGVVEYSVGLVRSRLPESLRPLGLSIAQRPWLAALAPVALAGIEWLRHRISMQSVLPRLIANVIAFAAAAWLAIGLLSSWFIAYPTSPLFVQRQSDVIDYVRKVMQTMAVPFRIGHHDQLLSILFWGGLGWVDTTPPEWVINLVVVATAAVTIWALIQAARTDAGRVARMVALVAGLAI